MHQQLYASLWMHLHLPHLDEELISLEKTSNKLYEIPLKFPFDSKSKSTFQDFSAFKLAQNFVKLIIFSIFDNSVSTITNESKSIDINSM